MGCDCAKMIKEEELVSDKEITQNQQPELERRELTFNE